MTALSRQVGGNHYKNKKIQPVEYIHANQMGYIEGAVVKYVTRYKEKNGRADLEKAIHFLEILIDLEYPVHNSGRSKKPRRPVPVPPVRRGKKAPRGKVV